MAQPDFQIKHTQDNCPDGVPVFMPAISIAAGSNKGVAFTHRPTSIQIINLASAADVIVNVALASGAISSAYFPITGAGGTLTLDKPYAVKELHFKNTHGSTAASVSVMAIYSRERIDSSQPDLTTANWFPQLDTSDTDALVPGVA